MWPLPGKLFPLMVSACYLFSWGSFRSLCLILTQPPACSLWIFVFIQSPSHVRHFMAPWIAAWQASLSLTISRSLPKFMSIASVMPSSHLSHPLCPFLLLPSIFHSISVFSNESALCFSFNISPSNEYSGLISFKISWLDLLAVEGTLKSLLQHHSSKAWIFILFLISKTATLAICYFLIRSLKLS